MYEDDLQDDLQDFQDPVEDEHFVWEVLNVSVKTSGDDGECRVQEGEQRPEPQQRLVEVEALFLRLQLVVQSL